MRVILLVLSLLLLSGATIAKPAPPVTIRATVTDQTGAIPASFRRNLDHLIRDHHKRTGVQIAVLVVKSTGSESIESFSLRVARHWKGGSAGRNDGVLLVLAIGDRKMRLEVGPGLASYITHDDAKSFLDAAKYSLEDKKYGPAVERIVSTVIGHTARIKAGISISDPPLGMRLPWPVTLVTIVGLIFGLFAGLLYRFGAGRENSTDGDKRASGKSSTKKRRKGKSSGKKTGGKQPQGPAGVLDKGVGFGRLGLPALIGGVPALIVVLVFLEAAMSWIYLPIYLIAAASSFCVVFYWEDRGFWLLIFCICLVVANHSDPRLLTDGALTFLLQYCLKGLGLAAGLGLILWVGSLFPDSSSYDSDGTSIGDVGSSGGGSSDSGWSGGGGDFGGDGATSSW